MKGVAVDVTSKLPLVDAVPPGVVTEDRTVGRARRARWR